MSGFLSQTAAEIRLVLTGQRSVVAGLQGVSTQVGRLQTSVQGLSRRTEENTKRTWLMNQALFTLRRYAYAATLAVTGLGAAAVVMGFKFNASMDTNMVAFTQFLGSAKAARQELDFLYELAKKTPFEFADVTEAARRFLAFGFSLKETNANLRIIGDTVAAFGGGREQIERMVTVFGQIRASGRLLGQDMLQLQQQGIPTMDILQKQLTKMGFTITRAQLARVGELGIPAEIGLPALLAGMKEMFGGASARQARTFMGQLSTLHDSISQVMGALTKPTFLKGRNALLPSLNRMFGEMGDLIKKQKGKITLSQIFDITQKHFPFMKPILDVIYQMIQIGKELARILQNTLVPALKTMGVITETVVVPIMKIMVTVLRWLAHYSGLLAPIITYLIAAFILEKTVMLVATAVEWGLVVATFALSLVQKNLTLISKGLAAATWLVVAAQRAWSVLMKGGIWGPGGFQKMNTFEKFLLRIHKMIRYRMIPALIGIGTGTAAGFSRAYQVLSRGFILGPGGFQKMSKFEKMLLRIRTFILGKFIPAIRAIGVAMMTFLVENPIVLIILAVVALIAILVVLYYKWGFFHRAVDNTWHWIKDHWKLLAAILIGPFLPFAAVIVFIIDHFKTLAGWAKTVYSWLKKAWDIAQKLAAPWHWVQRAAGFAAQVVTTQGTGNQFDSFVTTGTFPTSPQNRGTGGMLPLTPVNKIGQSVQYGTSTGKPNWDLTIQNNVHIDGKKVAENTSKHRQNKAARR